MKATIRRATGLGEWFQVRVDISATGEVRVSLAGEAATLAAYHFAGGAAGMVGARTLWARSELDDFTIWPDTGLP